MRIRGIIDRTDTNGPGSRTSIWTQGCTVGCRNCTNPETWQKDGPGSKEMGILEIVKKIEDNKKSHNIDGITFSGGEPLEQSDELFKVLMWLRLCTDLDVLVYSGRLISDVKNPAILDYIDIFVDGPFIEEEKNLSLLWRGSTNQKVYFLNDKIKDKMKNYYKLLDEKGNLIEGETGCEMTIDIDGTMNFTGFSNLSERTLKKLL